MHHLSADDKALILALRVQKRWNVRKMILEFPNKQWKRQTLYYLVRKIDQTGSAARLPGSVQPCTIIQDLINGAINMLLRDCSVLTCVMFVQRVVRMNKTEDDEMDAEELTDEELKQVAGACCRCY